MLLLGAACVDDCLGRAVAVVQRCTRLDQVGRQVHDMTTTGGKRDRGLVLKDTDIGRCGAQTHTEPLTVRAVHVSTVQRVTAKDQALARLHWIIGWLRRGVHVGHEFQRHVKTKLSGDEKITRIPHRNQGSATLLAVIGHDEADAVGQKPSQHCVESSVDMGSGDHPKR